MKLTSDVVVIGGGVTGASIAFHLARAGLGVVCVERKHPASGATGSSSAIIRMHYDNEPEMRMARRSLSYFQNWNEIIGEGNCGFQVTGFLRFVRQDHYGKLKRNVSKLQEIGVNTKLVSREEIKEIAPTFSAENIEFAAWEPDSGYADPCGTTFGFMAAALKGGANLLCPASVTAIEVRSSRVSSVRTDRGIISTRVVVNAAGAFASKVVEMAGCTIPVSPIRYQAGTFRRPLHLETMHPIVIDRHVGEFYFRPVGESHTLVGGIGAKEGIDPENFDQTPDPGYSDEAVRMLEKRIPGMERAVFRGGRAACDGISDDKYAIIDKLPQIEGFYCAVGHSGHGFKIAPAVGEAVAELITEGVASSVDISPFRYSRFKEGVNPFENPDLYGKRGQ